VKPLKKKSKSTYILGIVALVLSLGVWQGCSWWQGANSPVLSDRAATNKTEPIKFTVTSGMAGGQIGNKLVEAGLIKSLNAWKIWTWRQQKQDKEGGFKAGTYLLSPQDDLPTIATKIWRGEIMQTNFTIPEGWSIAQMGKYFESIDYFSAADFIAATKKIPRDKYPWLPENVPHLEGFLYPDTYQVSSDLISDPNAIIRVMLDRFEQIALPTYQEAQTQTNLSLLEWVALSSIVEKEAVIPQERPLIAGVFTARLKQGIRLESDPTVEYGLGIKQTADRPLTYDEIGTPSPYNTYMNAGIPPTAIASPGIASLKATLKPESTEYLFFVARYDGTHVFSKTLAEHETATRQIRRARQQGQ
jgi:UPF0755 protein